MDASDFVVGGSLDQFAMVPGTCLPSSARNLPQPNKSISLLTESSSHYILATNSSATMLNADHSQPSLIISPLLGPRQMLWTTPLMKQDVSLLWQSTQMMYNTCQVETMWSQMPCAEALPLLQCSLWNLILDNLLLTKLPQTRSTHIAQQSWASS